MANTFRKIYKKTGNNGNDSDYQLIANVGVNGVDLDIMKGATEESEGEIGLVPKAEIGKTNRYLASNGLWKTLTFNDVIFQKKSVSCAYNTHTRVNELIIEEPGLYIIFFRARISRVTGVAGDPQNPMGFCLVQTQLHSEGSSMVSYVASRPHFFSQNSSINEYDIVRISEPNTKVFMTVYHNIGGHTMTCEYSSISALLLEE